VIQPSTPPDPTAEYWTTSDVAAFCGVEVGTISSYRKREQMPAPDITVRTRTHLWRPERIVAWREEKLKKLVPDAAPVQEPVRAG
jgi:hypothetical protein